MIRALSAPIEEADKLLIALEEADVAIGSRALDRRLIETHQSVARETAGRIFNGMVRLLTGVAKVTSGYTSLVAVGTANGLVNVNVPNTNIRLYCPDVEYSPTQSVSVIYLQVQGNQYSSIFVGTDPNLAPANSIFATVSPTGGTFTEVSSASGDTFANVTSGGPGWVVNTTTQSASTGDRAITVKYAVSGEGQVSRSLQVTARQFAFATNNSPSNTCELGHGYLYKYVYTPYTHPDKAAVQAGIGIDGTAVPESFNPQLPAAWSTGTGALDANSQFQDYLGVCSTSPLSISSTTTTRTISIEGYQVRQVGRPCRSFAFLVSLLRGKRAQFFEQIHAQSPLDPRHGNPEFVTDKKSDSAENPPLVARDLRHRVTLRRATFPDTEGGVNCLLEADSEVSPRCWRARSPEDGGYFFRMLLKPSRSSFFLAASAVLAVS